MKKLAPVLIIIIAVVILLARRKKYNEFYEAGFNGRISELYLYRDYVMLTVNGAEYRIIPVIINGDGQFDKIAQIGDKVYKSENNDTLNLIHEEDMAYRFTVRKY